MPDAIEQERSVEEPASTAVGWSPGIEKVLAHVRETRGWYLRVPSLSPRGHWLGRRLGGDGHHACPASSLSGLPCDEYETAETVHGLTHDEVWAVVLASDEYDNFDPALRAALLDAAGLSEASS